MTLRQKIWLNLINIEIVTLYGVLTAFNKFNLLRKRIFHVRECRYCGARLGVQNPGDTCDTCKWVQESIRRREAGENAWEGRHVDRNVS